MGVNATALPSFMETTLSLTNKESTLPCVHGGHAILYKDQRSACVDSERGQNHKTCLAVATSH